MLNDYQNNKNISRNLKNKNSLLVTFFVLLFAVTFFCFYSFNNEAYFRIYFTYNNRLQKQKKADLKTEADEDKFLLIFFGIGIAILLLFIIFYTVKKTFFSWSLKVDEIENYYKAIEKVNEEKKNDLRKLRREFDKNGYQKFVKSILSRKEYDKSILEQFRICSQYLKSIGEDLEKKKNDPKVMKSLFKEYGPLKEKYNYFVSFINNIDKKIKEPQFIRTGYTIYNEVNDIAEFNKKVVQFRKEYNSFCSSFTESNFNIEEIEQDEECNEDEEEKKEEEKLESLKKKKKKNK